MQSTRKRNNRYFWKVFNGSSDAGVSIPSYSSRGHLVCIYAHKKLPKRSAEIQIDQALPNNCKNSTSAQQTPQNPLTLLLSEEKREKKGTLSSKPLFSQRFSSIALPPVMFLCKYSSPKLLGIAQKSILFNMHSMLKETQRHLGRGDRLVAVHQSIRGLPLCSM